MLILSFLPAESVVIGFKLAYNYCSGVLQYLVLMIKEMVIEVLKAEFPAKGLAFVRASSFEQWTQKSTSKSDIRGIVN